MKGIVFTFRKHQKVLRFPSVNGTKLTFRSFVGRYGYQTIFIILFLLGLAVGAAGSRGVSDSLGQKLDLLFITNIEARQQMTAPEIFLSCFVSYFLFIFCVFLCGLSAWGFSAIPLIAVMRGFIVGISSAMIFAGYHSSGIGFYILIVLPGTILFLLTLVMYSKEAFRLSLRFMRLSLFGVDKEPALSARLKAFIKKSAYAFLSSGACAVSDMLLWILFAGHFHFS